LALTLLEREEISRGIAAHQSARSMARKLGRSASTVAREIGRNGGYDRYRAAPADETAWARTCRPKRCKLAQSPRLRRAVARKLRLNWSPEQIAGWLKSVHPGDESQHVSHETIYRSLSRPTMRYVAIKSAEQQAALTVHRTRDFLVKQRTQLVKMIRGLLAEFGIEIRRGITHALSLAERIAAGDMPGIPALAAKMTASLAGQVLDLQARLRTIERELLAWHRANDVARRLATIPGVGTICATAFAASVTDPHQFRSGREFAAWLGLTPQQHSSGGKERLGRISKMGDKYLRRLLIVGMTSLVRRAKYKPNAVDRWLADLLSRKPVRVVTVALANKAARVIWAIMVRGGIYRALQPAGAVVS
jgi:transposase